MLGATRAAAWGVPGVSELSHRRNASAVVEDSIGRRTARVSEIVPVLSSWAAAAEAVGRIEAMENLCPNKRFASNETVSQSK